MGVGPCDALRQLLLHRDSRRSVKAVFLAHFPVQENGGVPASPLASSAMSMAFLRDTMGVNTSNAAVCVDLWPHILDANNAGEPSAAKSAKRAGAGAPSALKRGMRPAGGLGHHALDNNSPKRSSSRSLSCTYTPLLNRRIVTGDAATLHIVACAQAPSQGGTCHDALPRHSVTFDQKICN